MANTGFEHLPQLPRYQIYLSSLKRIGTWQDCIIGAGGARQSWLVRARHQAQLVVSWILTANIELLALRNRLHRTEQI